MGRKVNRRRKAGLGSENVAARKAGLVLTVKRRDALIRQLDTAIELSFTGRDVLSIHLIAMSAQQCLCDLGFNSTLKKEAGWTAFGLAYDWLRHASSDPHDVLDFPLRTNELLLYECIVGMKNVFGGSTVLMDTFALYFALHRVPEQPNIRENAVTKLPKGIILCEIEHLSLNDFLAKVMPVIAKNKVSMP